MSAEDVLTSNLDSTEEQTQVLYRQECSATVPAGLAINADVETCACGRKCLQGDGWIEKNLTDSIAHDLRTNF